MRKGKFSIELHNVSQLIFVQVNYVLD